MSDYTSAEEEKLFTAFKNAKRALSRFRLRYVTPGEDSGSENDVVRLGKEKELAERRLGRVRAKKEYNDFCKDRGLSPRNFGTHNSPGQVLEARQKRALTKGISELGKKIDVH